MSVSHADFGVMFLLLTLGSSIRIYLYFMKMLLSREYCGVWTVAISPLPLWAARCRLDQRGQDLMVEE